MKKRLCFLFCAALAAALLTVAAFAATPLKHIDIVFDMPKAGDPCEMETAVNVRSIKSGDIDLMAAGVTVMYTEWAGDDVETEDDEFLFRAGTTYLVTVKLAFDTTKGYCANYTNLMGDTVVTADTFTATVNGQPATARTSAPYFPTLQVSLTIEGERMSDTEKAELAAKQEKTAAALAQARRAVYPARTQAEADAANPINKGKTVVVMNGSDRGEGYNLGYLDQFDDIGTLIMDVDDSDFYNHYCAESTSDIIVWSRYLKEIWLSEKVDVYTFIGRMDNSLRSPLDHSPRWEVRSDLQFCSTDGTLYIPESAVPALIDKQTNGVTYIIPYNIKVYSGHDVYAAQKAGGAATKDWCPGHVFTQQIKTADRVYTFADCQTAPRWYYSCIICGKCEYNPNHVSARFRATAIEKLMEFTHATLYDQLATDQAYVGVNAAGMHVYWLSCDVCGRSDRYLQQHLTEKDLKLSGNDSTLEHYQAEVNAALQMRETLALSSTEDQAGMFTLRLRNTAKTSTWAQSDVNFALNDNLLDLELLGNDYTKNISRLQFCSVVVRLAEEMTGKTITPAAANTFTDTSSPYVLKAYAAGITSGTSETTFSPDATLNRQQMATFLYRTLRYIEKNSDYSYTSYTSKLANYTDRGQLESWAEESMAFMNALDLIKGTSDTTLSPNNKCTIEQAIAVAERSVYAHQIGWHQVVFSEQNDMGITDFLTLPVMGTNVGATPREGTIIWSLGKRLGVYMDEPEIDNNMPYTYCPVINYYTGQKQYIVARDLRPIRN